MRNLLKISVCKFYDIMNKMAAIFFYFGDHIGTLKAHDWYTVISISCAPFACFCFGSLQQSVVF